MCLQFQEWNELLQSGRVSIPLRGFVVPTGKRGWSQRGRSSVSIPLRGFVVPTGLFASGPISPLNHPKSSLMHIYFISSAGWMQILVKTVVIGCLPCPQKAVFESHISLYHPKITPISRCTSLMQISPRDSHRNKCVILNAQEPRVPSI